MRVLCVCLCIEHGTEFICSERERALALALAQPHTMMMMMMVTTAAVVAVECTIIVIIVINRHQQQWLCHGKTFLADETDFRVAE